MNVHVPKKRILSRAVALPQPLAEPEPGLILEPSQLPDRYGMIVKGVCLEPEIADGSCLLFDKTASYKPGDLVILWRRPELVKPGQPQSIVKRLYMAPPPWVKFPYRDTFNLSRIMQAAHATAKWRVASVGGSYREWFASALRTEWKRAKESRARREQNIGLPLRSCPADEPALFVRAPIAVTEPVRVPAWLVQVKRNAKFRTLYTRSSGRLAGSFGA